jgi:DNA gyrase subunit A
MVTEEEDVMIISNDGTIIRLPVRDINVYGRSTQGVILMRMEEDSRVISIEKVATEPEAEEETTANAAAEE